MKRTPAIAYLRVSGKAQAGADRDGFPRQREAIDRFAKGHGYEIVGEYRDEGISGTLELENRPALTALLARIKSNGVRTIIVERADRLARDLMAGEIILRELAKHNAKVLTADGHDLSAIDGDPTRTLIRQVLASVAQFEKTVLVTKLRAARQRKRARGDRVEGVRPYGYFPRKFPEEAKVIQRMKALRKKPKNGPRLSYDAIAQQLNAEGIPTRSQSVVAKQKAEGLPATKMKPKPWTRQAIERILEREKKRSG